MNEREENKSAEVENDLQIKCSSCGGVMRYSPAKQNLKCIYCGAEKELDKTPIKVEAYSYDQYSNKDGEQPAGDKEMQEVKEIKCGQCGAITTLPENVSSMKCPFCGTSLVLKEEKVNRTWTPDAILPFKVEDKEGKEAYKKWLSGKWFAPSELRKSVADTAAFQGVYMPFWAYDTNTTTIYTGQKGTKHKKTVEKDGKRETETEIEWSFTAGSVSVDFKNVLVPASETLPESISDVMKDWDLENSVAYSKEFVSGFVTELYSKDQVESVEKAEQIMEEKIEEQIRKDIGGDRQKIITKNITYNDMMFKLFLLPLWISSFNYNGKTYQFAVNGRTGEVTGDYPLSTWKVILAVVLGILVCVAFYLIFF